MATAYHYQNTFDNPLAQEFRQALSLGFSPLQLPRLYAWLDGKDNQTITTELGIATAWLDKSGNNRHATNSISSGPVNNTEGLYFAGNKYLNWDAISIFPEDCTIFIAAEFAAFNPSHSYPIADFDSTGNLARCAFRKLITGDYNFFSNSGLNISVPEPEGEQKLKAIFTIRRSAALKDAKLYIGGQLGGSDSYSSLTDAQGALKIGKSGDYSSPQYFRGTIFELIVSGMPLDEDDRLKVELYLAKRHSLIHTNL